MGWQRFDVLGASYVDQHASRNDWRNGRDVSLAQAEVAPPIRSLEAVVEVVIGSMRDVTQAIDLVATLSLMKIALLCQAVPPVLPPSGVVNGRSCWLFTPAGDRKLMRHERGMGGIARLSARGLQVNSEVVPSPTDRALRSRLLPALARRIRLSVF
jgi:hypothetical protein